MYLFTCLYSAEYSCQICLPRNPRRKKTTRMQLYSLVALRYPIGTSCPWHATQNCYPRRSTGDSAGRTLRDYQTQTDTTLSALKLCTWGRPKWHTYLSQVYRPHTWMRYFGSRPSETQVMQSTSQHSKTPADTWRMRSTSKHDQQKSALCFSSLVLSFNNGILCTPSLPDSFLSGA